MFLLNKRRPKCIYIFSRINMSIKYRINSLVFYYKGCFYGIFSEQKSHDHEKLKKRVKNATYIPLKTSKYMDNTTKAIK